MDLNVVKDGNGYIADTRLNESPPWRFRYGFAVSDQLQTSDRNLGGTADFSYSNLLGKGITVGSSFKYAADLRDGRIFGSLPVFLGKNATTSATLFRTRDLTIPGSITDLLGFTLQQQWKLHDSYLLSYDYSYKRNHTFDKTFDPNDPFAFNITIPIARLNGTLSRDTRDDILNATKGAFLSTASKSRRPALGLPFNSSEITYSTSASNQSNTACLGERYSSRCRQRLSWTGPDSHREIPCRRWFNAPRFSAGSARGPGRRSLRCQSGAAFPAILAFERSEFYGCRQRLFFVP